MELQADKIIALTGAADVDLDSIWASLLAKALEGKNVKELLLNVGTGGGGPATAVAAGGAPGCVPEAEEKEEEKKEEEKEESDDDMVCFSLFTRSDSRLTGYPSRALVFSINLLEPHKCTPSTTQMHLPHFQSSAITFSGVRYMMLHLSHGEYVTRLFVQVLPPTLNKFDDTFARSSLKNLRRGRGGRHPTSYHRHPRGKRETWIWTDHLLTGVLNDETFYKLLDSCSNRSASALGLDRGSTSLLPRLVFFGILTRVP